MDESQDTPKTEITFKAIYGDKEDESWDTKLDEIKKWFQENQEKMLSTNGKIDLSVLFKDDNIEDNPLYVQTDHFSDVFYIYDTYFVLHFIKRWEQIKKNKGEIVEKRDDDFLSISECEWFIYRIIQTKWLACLATLYISVIYKENQRVLDLCKKYIKYILRILPSSSDVFPIVADISNENDVPMIISTINNNMNNILLEINMWRNDLIIDLLSMNPNVLNECQNIDFPPLRFCFEELPENLDNYGQWDEKFNKYLLAVKKHKSWSSKIKCVALTYQFENYDNKNNEYIYAINGIDYNNSKKEICTELENVIAKVLDVNKTRIRRCVLVDDVEYVTKDGKVLKYGNFMMKKSTSCCKCPYHKCCICEKNKDCKIPSDNNCTMKKRMCKKTCHRMFTCSERKLFIDIGPNREQNVFTTFKNCDLCVAVKVLLYPRINLVYPWEDELHKDYDPIAKVFI